MTDLLWRRSSRCEAHSCIEVAWRTACVAEAHCVAVGHTGGEVLVRDTKLGAASPILSFTPTAWTAFTAGIRAGDLRP
jgi:hypothetical protein